MIARLKRFQCWAQALTASTEAPAVTVPPGVSAIDRVAGAEARDGGRLEDADALGHAARCGGRAPAAPAARSRRSVENTPPRTTGESIRARASSWLSTCRWSSFRRSAVMTASAHSPICESLVASPSSPSARNHASNSWSSQNAPIPSTLVLAGAANRSAASSPNRSHRNVRSPQNEFDEPAVAPARAAAADVLLEEHDVDAGVELREEPRGPHPGVAAADDHDVGRGVLDERRARLAGERRQGERLAQPPAAAFVGRDR